MEDEEEGTFRVTYDSSLLAVIQLYSEAYGGHGTYYDISLDVDIDKVFTYDELVEEDVDSDVLDLLL